MKILIYGAGVLGSYLAHELHRGGNEVTILARTERFNHLITKGLVIEHVRQKIKTVDQVRITDSLMPEDCYDVIFVVMQKSQISDTLPTLTNNTASKKIVFIGNNCEADKTHSTFMRLSESKPMVLFGFLSCAGHRSGSVIYNWHSKKSSILMGAYQKDDEFANEMRDIFSGTSLALEIKRDINGWLKYHCALVAPICLAIQYENGASKSLRKSKVLSLAIDAVKESIQMFEQQGFQNEAPHNIKLLGWPTNKIQWILSRLLSTKTGQFIAVDHALAACDEISMLARELLSYSEENDYSLSSLRQRHATVEEITHA